MGLLITLFLILTNVYNSVKAPMSRGFSLIEVWLLGTSFPILAAIMEYAYILNILRNQNSKLFGKELEDLTCYLKNVDLIAFLSASVYLLIFFMIYWLVALTLWIINPWEIALHFSVQNYMWQLVFTLKVIIYLAHYNIKLQQFTCKVRAHLVV